LLRYKAFIYCYTRNRDLFIEKMKRTTKFIILYVSLFALMSTFFMWYSIDSALHIESQPISPNEDKGRVISSNCSITLGQQQQQPTPAIDDVKSVALSLKTGLFDDSSTTFSDYFDHSPENIFAHALSMYDTKELDILKTLFPIRPKSKGTHADRIMRQLIAKLKYAEPKLILAYFYDNSLTASSITRHECEVDSCRVTTDRNQMENADAVVFHQISENVRRPNNRTQQVWVYHQLESPDNIRYVTRKHNLLVNWTATFRSDSVLVTPYGKFVTHQNFHQLPIKTMRNYAQGKTKLVAWFVSNCGGFNGRMAYARHLQKYTKVDVYGFCGPLKCQRGNNGGKCVEMLRRDYKFYLAFENSNCRDYITEKFFYNALQ